MSNLLEGKVIVVSGASEGIGRAVAERCAVEGAHVAICARRPEPLAKAEALIREAGGSVTAVVLDVADGGAFTAFIDDTAQRHGRLDGLVNNAFSFTFSSLADTTLDSWRQAFLLNAEIPFVGVQTAMRHMQAQGSGSIVNISTVNALLASENHASYSASKAAMIHFGRVAAMELAPFGVRVNAVAPGMTLTEGMEVFMRDAPEAFARIRDSMPMKRACQPSEIANAVVWLLSDESSYVTGICLPVDGGKTAHMWLPHDA